MAVVDASGQVIVNGPVSSRKTSKSFVLKVTNEGTGPLTLDLGAALSGSVTVNGTPTGEVTGPTGTDTINPGRSVKYKLAWTYPAGSVATGDTVEFTACVSATGDIDTTNDCGTATVTAK